MPKSVISPQTAQEIIEYYAAGFRVCEITNMTGIKQSTVRMFLNRNEDKIKKERELQNDLMKVTVKPNSETKALPAESKEEQPAPAPAPVKEKTLKDFKSRDMIKYLYDMGYRIENNQLVCLVKQVVNVKDIIHS